MKRRVYIASVFLVLLAVALVACGEGTEAGEPTNTYIKESDEYNNFHLYEIVHKDTGCHYMMTKNKSSGDQQLTQMMDVDGKPYCD